jgi:predicted dehydrogenase
LNKVGVGIVGCGLMGEVHAKTYHDYENSELICVCDLNEKMARDVAAIYHCEYTTDIERLAENTRIKAVSIATPDFAHTEPALKMIEAGKDVLIEKPMTTNVGEARKIVDEAKRMGIKVMVDFQNRWNPIFAMAKQAILEGKIGKPVMGYARLSNPLQIPLKMLSWASKSGPEWFLLPHILDLMSWLVDEAPKEVYASGRKGILEMEGITAYDSIHAMVKFGSCFATFETSWILPDSWPSLVDFDSMILGSAGRIGVQGDKQGIDIAAEGYSWPFVLGLQEIYGRRFGFFREPIIHFVDCLLNDKEPACTGEDGLRVTATIDAALTSIREGRKVRIKEG